MDYILCIIIGAVVIFWVLVIPTKKSDNEEHPAQPGEEIYYRLSESGKARIAEQIEIHAKDFCNDRGWHEEAEQAANTSKDFRENVEITIPAHLTLSGKVINVRLGRQHFIKLSRLPNS